MKRGPKKEEPKKTCTMRLSMKAVKKLTNHWALKGEKPGDCISRLILEHL